MANDSYVWFGVDIKMTYTYSHSHQEKNGKTENTEPHKEVCQ